MSPRGLDSTEEQRELAISYYREFCTSILYIQQVSKQHPTDLNTPAGSLTYTLHNMVLNDYLINYIHMILESISKNNMVLHAIMYKKERKKPHPSIYQ